LTPLAFDTSTTLVIDDIPGYTLVLDSLRPHSLDAADQPARKKLRYIAKPDQHPDFFGGSDFISDRIHPDIFGMEFDAFFRRQHVRRRRPGSRGGPRAPRHWQDWHCVARLWAYRSADS
jgi:hypothetical protein